MERVTAWWMTSSSSGDERIRRATRYSWRKVEMVTKEMKFTESYLSVVALWLDLSSDQKK